VRAIFDKEKDNENENDAEEEMQGMGDRRRLGGDASPYLLSRGAA
jgi:hypothetical protein